MRQFFAVSPPYESDAKEGDETAEKLTYQWENGEKHMVAEQTRGITQ